MNDDGRTTDERIAEAARELFHAPPPAPREEMWSTIEARLGGASEPAALDTFRASRRSGRAGWWIAIAAALLIGLGIGRLVPGTDAENPGVAVGTDATEVEVAGAETPGALERIPGAEDSMAGAIGDPSPAERLADAETIPARPARTGDRAAAAPDSPPASSGTPSGTPFAAPADEGHGVAPGLPYLVATRAHLGRSETFLAGVRASLELEAPDPEFEAWARSLLTRTRLLMASPAGRDPTTRRLLEDLELMLAQIAVTAASGDSGEARILGRDLEDGDLLYRLRSASENQRARGAAPVTGTSSL